MLLANKIECGKNSKGVVFYFAFSYLLYLLHFLLSLLGPLRLNQLHFYFGLASLAEGAVPGWSLLHGVAIGIHDILQNLVYVGGLIDELNGLPGLLFPAFQYVPFGGVQPVEVCEIDELQHTGQYRQPEYDPPALFWFREQAQQESEEEPEGSPEHKHDLMQRPQRSWYFLGHDLLHVEWGDAADAANREALPQPGHKEHEGSGDEWEGAEDNGQAAQDHETLPARESGNQMSGEDGAEGSSEAGGAGQHTLRQRPRVVLQMEDGHNAIEIDTVEWSQAVPVVKCAQPAVEGQLHQC